MVTTSKPPDRPAGGSGVARTAGRRLGSLLVVAQFGLIGTLGWLGLPCLSLVEWYLSLALYLIAAGTGVGLAALFANRPGNFNIHPAPRAGGTLVTRGIYHWIRHPMYTAVLTIGLGASWAANSWCSRLVWLALLAVLVCKALLEEDWMLATHPGYAAYSARTARFLPGIY